MRESMIIYRSFFEAINELPKENQADIWEAVFEYGFNNKQPKLSGISATIFKLILPQLDANIRRYDVGKANGTKGAKHGKKGGRPPKEKPLNNPQETPNETPEKPANVNYNSNLNNNSNANENDLNVFNEFRILYPGVKKGNETEFENFKKKHKDWKQILPLLHEKLSYQIGVRARRLANRDFVPEWKNLPTWINQRCWEEIIEEPKPTYIPSINGEKPSDMPHEKWNKTLKKPRGQYDCDSDYFTNAPLWTKREEPQYVIVYGRSVRIDVAPLYKEFIEKQN